MTDVTGQYRRDEPGMLLLGRYRLRHLLGSGASADVWLADDERLGRAVALKLLHPHLFPDVASRERFAAEARAAARVSHPGIVGVHDVVIDGRTAAIVFEYVPGETLDARIRRRGRLAVNEAADIAAQLAEALAAAHAAGVVHRDVKPSNILMDASGHPRLADFGIAQALGEAQGLTRAGEVVGTLRSLAPEQLAGWPGTPAADLYALGTVLYEMLAGRPPYDATTPLALVEQQKHPPAPIAGLPPGLAALILRCLQPNPAVRPASAIEVASYLRGWLAGAAPAATPGAVRLPATPQVPVPRLAETGATTITGSAGAARRRPPDGGSPSLVRRVVLTALLVVPVIAAVVAGLPVLESLASPSVPPGVAERGTPTPRPTATPTPRPTPTPTPRPTPTPTPTPSPTPQPLPASLSITSPTDGVQTNADSIKVVGLAPPGATVTRDIPLWPDDHVTADSKGRWSMRVGLNFGPNHLTFRLGDDRSTDVQITVYYEP